MKKITINLAACIIVMLAACNKENPSVPSVVLASTASSVSLNTLSADPAANTKNPYDSIGLIHNKVLGVIWDYVQQTKDTTANGIRSRVSDFFKQRYGTDINARLTQAAIYFTKDFPAWQVAGAPKGYFTPITEAYLNSILDAIRRTKDLDGYGLFHSTVTDIENKVLLDKNLSMAERQHILMVASVARYSVAYWMGKAATASPDTSSSLMGFLVISGGQLIAGLPMPEALLMA